MSIDLCSFIRKVNILCALFVAFLVYVGDLKTGMLVLGFVILVQEVRDILTHAHMGAFELKEEAKRRRNLL